MFRQWKTIAMILKTNMLDLKEGRWALLGQVFAFSTLLLPVLIGRTEWLAPLAFASAVSTVLTPTLTLAGRSIIQIAGSQQIQRQIKFATLLIVIGFIAPGLAAVSLPLSSEIKTWLLCLAFVNLGMPLYNLVAGLCIRVGSVDELSKLRFKSNALVLVITCISIISGFGPIGLAFAVGAGFCVPSLISLRQTLKSEAARNSTSEDTQVVSNARILRNIAVTTGSSLVHQSYSLVIPALGSYAGVWALICRIVSGFETIGGVVIGPILEARALRSIKSLDFEDFTKIRLKKLTLSIFLGLSAVSVILIAVGILYLTNPPQYTNIALVLLTSSTYAFCLTFAAVTGPVLYVLRAEINQIPSDLIKTVPFFTLFISSNPEMELLAILISIALSTFLLTWTQGKVSRKYFEGRAKSSLKLMILRLYNWFFLLNTTQKTLFWLDDLIVRRGESQSNEARVHLLYCSAFSGNIGDQAMADSFITNVKGSKLIATPYVPTLEQIEFYRLNDAEIRVISGLVSSPSLQRLRSLRTLGSLLSRAKTFSIVGADVMDGGYFIFESLGRMSLLSLANQRDIPTRILGFSWRASAPSQLTRVLKSFEGKTRLLLRDVDSYRNLDSLGVSGIVQVTDSAFSLQPRNPDSDFRSWIDSSKNDFACLNVSALIESRGGLKGGYGEIVKKLHDSGLRVVFVPHVMTSRENDDVEQCRKVYEQFSADGDLFISRILSPQLILGIVKNSRVVITGRMHLAILSLLSEVPTITFETQGKVLGLYRSLDLRSLVVDPAGNAPEKVVDQIEYILKDVEIGRKISAKLPDLVKLSALNFIDL